MAETEQEAPESKPETPAVPAETGQDQNVTWTASEFIAHEKSAGWFLLLILGTLIFAAMVFLITRDKISVAVVIVAGLLFGVYARHQPRQLEYQINRSGLSIGGKRYTFNEFRSFSVVPEGAFASIVFMPLKRFAAPITIYYAPDDEKRIMAILSAQLPFEEKSGDAIDRLMRKVRF